MGDLIEPGTHRSTNIKVKIKILKKKSEMYFSNCIEPKDFIHAFLTVQLIRTLIKKSDMKDTQNVQNIRKFEFSNVCNVSKTC